jgi:Uma2 family endonuclease
MNIHTIHQPRPVPSTQAADGLPRRAFTFDDVVRMVEAGIIGPKERIELIGGELVVMSTKGMRHETVKMKLLRHFIKIEPPHLAVIPETTFRLSPDDYVEPDILVYPSGGLRTLNGTSALLAVEIADSSITYDLNHKAKLYASFGVREYWVINANRQTTTAHLGPGAEGYASVTTYDADVLLTPHLAPELAVSLASLDVDNA